jgi:hypothetical protein
MDTRLEYFIQRLRHAPELVTFEETIELIDALYDFTPTAFDNGSQHNSAGENTGSCKILAFARLNDLTREETLACFGRYYRKDVLGNPHCTSHTNIRNFLTHGWEGVHYFGSALSSKSTR